MRYSKEGPRVFVPYQYDEITIENIIEACEISFCQHHLCDILASEMGLSYSRVEKSHISKYCIFDLLVFDLSRVDMSVNILNPLITQAHQKYHQKV